MSESNFITPISGQSSESQEFDYIATSTNVDVDTQMSNYVIGLHETLDIDELIDVFTDELRNIVAFGSIEYIDKTTQTSIINGVTGRQRCVYALRYGEQSLGSISMTRDAIFLEHEIENIEVMLAGLTLPLRNALSYKKVVNSSQRDELTGLRNENYYNDVIDLEIKRAQRYKNPFSLLIFDVDNLKDISDQYGKNSADAMLVEIARRIERKARSSDIVYRYAGDKFLVFLPNTENEKAAEAANRIKDFVSSEKCICENDIMAFTISVGVVTVAFEDTVDLLMNRVNKSLKQADMLRNNHMHGDLQSQNSQVGHA